MAAPNDGYTHVCPYSLYCFTKARLLTTHLPDCSIHPEQKVEYPSHGRSGENYKKSSKPLQKIFPVLCVLYADFKAFMGLWKKLKRVLRSQGWDNSINRMGSPAFESPRCRNLTGTYLATAAKIQISGPLRPKHRVKRETDEDTNGGTTVAARCGHDLRALSRSIHKEKQKEETSLPSQRTLHRSLL